jgi:hypothetical protein
MQSMLFGEEIRGVAFWTRITAFEYKLTWILAKGLDIEVVNRLINHLTIVDSVCRRLHIRQGDRPNSTLFYYGLDPHL